MLTKIYRILSGSDKRIQRSSYMWNTISGISVAAQSVLILMVIMRTTGANDAGIFTIAFATANIISTAGKYGVRSYQVTDSADEYTFSDYTTFRLITCVLILLAGIIYIGVEVGSGEYSPAKGAITLVLCTQKLIDALEDVIHGLYQKKGRLDISGRSLFLRIIASTIVLIAVMIITGNLLFSAIVSTFVALGIFIVFTVASLPHFAALSIHIEFKTMIKLFAACFPLFVCSISNLYIYNAPKYAIDAYLSESLQAYYGFLSMPIFVIVLLNNFVFQPILAKLAVDLSKREYKTVMTMIRRQSIILLGISAVCILAGAAVGIPVLSFLFNASLNGYRTDLIILLFGGLMFAVSALSATLLTVIRFQKSLTWCYGIVSISAFFLCPFMVSHYGLRGASYAYTIIATLLAILLLGCFILRFRSEMNRNNVSDIDEKHNIMIDKTPKMQEDP